MTLSYSTLKVKAGSEWSFTVLHCSKFHKDTIPHHFDYILCSAIAKALLGFTNIYHNSQPICKIFDFSSFSVSDRNRCFLCYLLRTKVWIFVLQSSSNGNFVDMFYRFISISQTIQYDWENRNLPSFGWSKMYTLKISSPWGQILMQFQ